MALSNAQKQEIMAKYAFSAKDVGSTPVQIALLTEQIKQLTGHLQQFRKDLHSQRGLMSMVRRRRRLLNYLSHVNPTLYKQMLTDLNLRN